MSEAPPLLARAPRRPSRRWTPSLSRDTYLEAWGAALFAGRLCERREACRRYPRAALTAPRLAGPAAPCRPAAGRLGAWSSPGGALPRRPVLRARDGELRRQRRPVSSRSLRWGWLATRGGGLPLGFRQLSRDRHARRRVRPPLRGARSPRGQRQRASARRSPFAGDFAKSRALLIAEARPIREATGTRVASVMARWCSRALCGDARPRPLR